MQLSVLDNQGDKISDYADDITPIKFDDRVKAFIKSYQDSWDSIPNVSDAGLFEPPRSIDYPGVKEPSNIRVDPEERLMFQSNTSYLNWLKTHNTDYGDKFEFAYRPNTVPYIDKTTGLMLKYAPYRIYKDKDANYDFLDKEGFIRPPPAKKKKIDTTDILPKVETPIYQPSAGGMKVNRDPSVGKTDARNGALDPRQNPPPPPAPFAPLPPPPPPAPPPAEGAPALDPDWARYLKSLGVEDIGDNASNEHSNQNSRGHKTNNDAENDQIIKNILEETVNEQPSAEKDIMRAVERRIMKFALAPGGGKVYLDLFSLDTNEQLMRVEIPNEVKERDNMKSQDGNGYGFRIKKMTPPSGTSSAQDVLGMQHLVFTDINEANNFKTYFLSPERNVLHSPRGSRNATKPKQNTGGSITATKPKQNLRNKSLPSRTPRQTTTEGTPQQAEGLKFNTPPRRPTQSTSRPTQSTKRTSSKRTSAEKRPLMLSPKVKQQLENAVRRGLLYNFNKTKK